MAISAMQSLDGTTLTIKMAEKFDFNVHAQLRAAYRGEGKRFTGYVVDLQDTTYMDSSALGMLLQIKEFAGGSAQSVRIRNAGTSIKDILEIANFQKLMTIE
jgi:HptB-dependent secretion and biofilm anti anti-sigma factor